MIKKQLFILTLLSIFLFSATPEQVEKYLSISNSEEQLIRLEKEFSQMQNNINRLDTNSSKERSSYDMQMLSIRFREYLQKELSENEMDEILQQYKNVLLLEFVSTQNDSSYDPIQASKYIEELQKNTEAFSRIDVTQKIAKSLYKKESITILFDNLMQPLIENSMKGKKIDNTLIKKSKEIYIKTMLKEGETEIFYLTKDFTVEELEMLLKIAKTPTMDHESKAVFGAMAYTLKEFFLSLSSRYNAQEHQK